MFAEELIAHAFPQVYDLLNTKAEALNVRWNVRHGFFVQVCNVLPSLADPRTHSGPPHRTFFW